MQSIWVNNPQAKTLASLIAKYPHAPFIIRSDGKQGFIEITFELPNQSLINYQIFMDGHTVFECDCGQWEYQECRCDE